MKKLAATILVMSALFTGVFAQTTQNVKKTSTASTASAAHTLPKSNSSVKTKDVTKKTTPATTQSTVAVKHKHKHKHSSAKKEAKK
jgi:hypothetical protein